MDQQHQSTSTNAVPLSRRSHRYSDNINERARSASRRAINIPGTNATSTAPSTPLMSPANNPTFIRRTPSSFSKSHQRFLQARLDRDKLHSPPKNQFQFQPQQQYHNQYTNNVKDDTDFDDADDEDLDLLVNSSMDVITESFDNPNYSSTHSRQINIPKSLSYQHNMSANLVQPQSPRKRNSMTVDAPLRSTSVSANNPSSTVNKSGSLWDDLESVKERLRRMKMSQGIDTHEKGGDIKGSQQHFNYYNQNNQETLNNNYNSIYQTPRASYKSPTIPSASIAKSSVYSSRPAERHLCEVLDSLKRIRNTISNSNLSDSNPDGNGSFEYDTLTPSSSVFSLLVCMMEHAASDLLAVYPTISSPQEMAIMDDISQLEAVDKAALSLAGFILQFLDAHKLSCLKDASNSTSTNGSSSRLGGSTITKSAMENMPFEGALSRGRDRSQSQRPLSVGVPSPRLANINTFAGFGIINPPVASSSSMSSMTTNNSNSSSSVSEAYNQASVSTNSTAMSSTNTMLNNPSPKTTHHHIVKNRGRMSSLGGQSSNLNGTTNMSGLGFHKKSVSYNNQLNQQLNQGAGLFEYETLEPNHRDNSPFFSHGNIATIYSNNSQGYSNSNNDSNSMGNEYYQHSHTFTTPSMNTTSTSSRLGHHFKDRFDGFERGPGTNYNVPSRRAGLSQSMTYSSNLNSHTNANSHLIHNGFGGPSNEMPGRPKRHSMTFM